MLFAFPLLVPELPFFAIDELELRQLDSTFVKIDVSYLDLKVVGAIVRVFDRQLLEIDLSTNDLHGHDIIAFSCGAKLLEYLHFGLFSDLVHHLEILLLLNSVSCSHFAHTRISKLLLFDSLKPLSFPGVFISLQIFVRAQLLRFQHVLLKGLLDLSWIHRC